MKNLFYVFCGVYLILSASSCHDEDFFGCVRGNGDIESEELFLPEFTGVKLEGVGDVFIRYGDEQKVIVETDRNLLDYLETDVRNGVWEIEFDHCIKKITELNIYITLPEINRVIVTGSGSITGEDQFTGNDLEINLSGSGDIDFDFAGTKVEANITGSGSIDLFGSAEYLDLNISGSGDMRAFDMIAKECDVWISGSGDARVYVEDFLKVRISGSGDVLYMGYPQVDVDITGSGRVLNRN